MKLFATGNAYLRTLQFFVQVLTYTEALARTKNIYTTRGAQQSILIQHAR